MGACFNVSLSLRLKDEEGARKALQERFENVGRWEYFYDLDQHTADLGLDPTNLHDLLRVFFADGAGELEATSDGVTLKADFHGRYGYGARMKCVFYSLGPFLQDGSFVEITSDFSFSDCHTSHVTIFDGRAYLSERP